MYTFRVRKTLIFNNAKRGYASGAYPRFIYHKDNTFSVGFQISFNVLCIFDKTGSMLRSAFSPPKRGTKSASEGGGDEENRARPAKAYWDRKHKPRSGKRKSFPPPETRTMRGVLGKTPR